MTTTATVLLEKYGLLLTYQQLAEVLCRQPEGLRISLSQGRDDWARKVNGAKVRIGRRVLFRSAQIAEVIDGQV